VEIRTDRLGVLVDQLRQSAELSAARMDGLTDDEFLWEPVAGMWSLRKRGEAATSAAYGPGDWVIDHERIDPFAPGPPSTIAWRIGHLVSGLAGRWEWTFGARSADPKELIEFSPHATTALSELSFQVERWIAAIDSMTDEQLDVPGFGQYPMGLDPQIPFIGILWWVNREFIHHMAEVALLRDLYRAGLPVAGIGVTAL
jgi:hypothetical protein